MDVYELRSFVVLAEQLHFGRAASILHLSQPALTKQIRKIESELGSSLFERGTQGTRLTALGFSWLPQVRETLVKFDQLVLDGQKGAQGQIGRLKIGFGFHTLDLVPPVVVKLREQSPRVEISLQDMSTREQMLALQEGRLDIGFVRMSAVSSSKYTLLPVVKDRLTLVSASANVTETVATAADDRAEMKTLAGAGAREGARTAGGEKRLTLADCVDRPFVMISKERSPGFYGHVLQLCASQGFHPRVVQEVTEFTTALALVRAGMGVTIIPESMWQNTFTGVSSHRIAQRDATWSVSAVWRKGDTNPVLAKFLEMLRASIR